VERGKATKALPQGSIMISKEDTTGLILAGGAGRRVGGKDKGLIVWQGIPLVEHVLKRLAPQVGPVIISCNRNRSLYDSYDVQTVTDTRRNFQGPLAGLEAAKPLIRTSFLIISSCDAPALPRDLAEKLLRALASDENQGIDIAYAWDGCREQYLHAALRTRVVDDLHAYMERGGRTVRHWYGRHKCVRVDFSEQPESFYNLNRLEA
jgi:molybdenum cofactor guanylyltransferase